MKALFYTDDRTNRYLPVQLKLIRKQPSNPTWSATKMVNCVVTPHDGWTYTVVEDPGHPMDDTIRKSFEIFMNVTDLSINGWTHSKNSYPSWISIGSPNHKGAKMLVCHDLKMNLVDIPEDVISRYYQ
jgi:hypothetical protein